MLSICAAPAAPAPDDATVSFFLDSEATGAAGEGEAGEITARMFGALVLPVHRGHVASFDGWVGGVCMSFPCARLPVEREARLTRCRPSIPEVPCEADKRACRESQAPARYVDRRKGQRVVPPRWKASTLSVFSGVPDATPSTRNLGRVARSRRPCCAPATQPPVPTPDLRRMTRTTVG